MFGTDYLESDHFRQLLKIMNELPKVGTFVHFTPKIIQKYANLWQKSAVALKSKQNNQNKTCGVQESSNMYYF